MEHTRPQQLSAGREYHHPLSSEESFQPGHDTRSLLASMETLVRSVGLLLGC